jgi:undecaprenyl-diphosphatase
MGLLSLVKNFDEKCSQKILLLPRDFLPYFEVASYVGGPFGISIVATVTAIIGIILGRKDVLEAMAVSILACLGVLGIKQIVRRSRPHNGSLKTRFQFYSFPSGHAYASATVGSILAYFSAVSIIWPLNLAVSIIIISLILLIGLSRIYLKAHYPSDVLAGWLLSIISLFMVIKFVLISV